MTECSKMPSLKITDAL